MIKTLRITGAIAAVLAVGFFAFSAVYGFRDDQKIEEFLKTPSVAEKFKKPAKGGRAGRRDKNQDSPLIVQARAFALYLNPPPPPPPPSKGRDVTPDGGKSLQPPPPPPPPTAKFTVVATSFCESAPELSLALIDEPAKGRHWIRPKAVINHVVVEQIRDGFLVVRERKGTRELPVEQRPPTRRDFLLGSAPVSSGPGVATGYLAATADTRGPDTSSGGSEAAPKKGVRDLRNMRSAAGAGKIDAPPQSDEEAVAMMKKLVEQVEEMRAAAAAAQGQAGQPEARLPVQNALSDPQVTHVTGPEAEKLDRVSPQPGEKKPAAADVRRRPKRRTRQDLIEHRKKLMKEKAERAKAALEQPKPD
ncbi:MAG: hypothetical protein ACYTBJ_09635 [Planctomycetota bacterium]|jgi:hypothetical protein